MTESSKFDNEIKMYQIFVICGCEFLLFTFTILSLLEVLHLWKITYRYELNTKSKTQGCR